MKIKQGQTVVTIRDVEKYIESLMIRCQQLSSNKPVSNRRFDQFSEAQAKWRNAERILESMRAAKAAQVDPTLTRSIPLPPQ